MKLRAGLISFVAVFVTASLVLASSTGRRRVPQWHIKMAQSQGPNTCAVEEIPGTNKKFWTECRYWMHRKICGKKTVIRYECCEGFDTVPGDKGCTAVKPLKSLIETAEDLGATIFVKHLRDAGLTERLMREGAYTLFAPINSAFESLSTAQNEQLQRSKNNPWSPVLLNHLAEGRIHSNEIYADNLIPTMARGQQLRINKYSNGMITVNCAPIVRKDQEATNGIVHLVENFLDPIVALNLPEAMNKDGRFVQLHGLLRETQMDSGLLTGGPYTIFAPYDEAFQKYPASRLVRIRGDESAKRALMQSHIIPHPLCLPAVIDEHKMRTQSGDKLMVMCNETGTYVGHSRLSGEVIIANNGIIHLIGDILVPHRAKSVLEIMEDNAEAKTFMEFVQLAGVGTALDEAGNLTVFAPSQEAFQKLPEEELSRLRRDTAAARDLVMYHIVQGRYKTDAVRDDQRIRCVDGKNSLRMRVYRKVPGNKGYGVESAMIKTSDTEGQNGVIHLIDKVLKPPTENIVEVLQNDGNFSIMLEALQKVRAIDPDVLSVDTRTGHTSLTLFAPSDEAFRKLDKEQLQKVMTDTEYLTQVVKNHIVDNMVPSCAFNSKLHYNVKTKQNVVEIQKRNHHIEFGGAHVLKPDLVTRDGIVHFVDQVILPEDSAIHRPCIKCNVENQQHY